jgi:hypothetical protein
LGRAQGVPVIVTVVVLDRLWAAITDDGIAAALRTTMHTAMAAIVVLMVLSTDSIHVLSLDHPLIIVASGVLLSVIAGSYRGLRLSEFVRFRPVPRAVVATTSPLLIRLDDGSPAAEPAR